jgi:NDP-sugar pyrophosphorylase family protein
VFETAVILAAGSGSRMAPLTERTPKALVEVGGQPLIQYSIDLFRSVGVKSIVVTYGHKGEQVLQALRGKADAFIDTSGKGNASALFSPLIRSIDAPILISPCDMIAQIDLKELYRDYLDLGSPASCVVPVKSNANADSLKLEGAKVLSIARDNTSTLRASGLQIVNPSKVTKAYDASDDFYRVWAALIELEMLHCSRVAPLRWKVFDTVSDVLLFEGKSV